MTIWYFLHLRFSDTKFGLFWSKMPLLITTCFQESAKNFTNISQLKKKKKTQNLLVQKTFSYEHLVYCEYEFYCEYIRFWAHCLLVHNGIKTFCTSATSQGLYLTTVPFRKARLDRYINIQASNCDFKNFLVTFWSGIFPFFCCCCWFVLPFSSVSLWFYG